MKKSILIVLVLLPLCQLANSQVTETEKLLKTQKADTIVGWRKGAVVALNLSQTSLTHWAAGGQSSMAINGIVSLFANYKKDKKAWDNSLDIGYGLLKQGDEKTDKYRKTDDKIDLLSKYGQEAFKNFYYAGLLNFKTQMQPGYNYPNDSVKISNFLAPAYLLGAIGLDYKPNSYFGAFVAPFTGKFTIVNDKALSNAGAFGVIKGEKLKKEVGGYIRVIYSRNDFKSEWLKNISFTTKFDAFSNYINNPQNVDISWETLIAMKVNKYISVNFNTQLLYDDDAKILIDPKTGRTGKRIQFKEILGVGISFRL